MGAKTADEYGRIAVFIEEVVGIADEIAAECGSD
jgi:hypothetical protein